MRRGDELTEPQAGVGPPFGGNGVPTQLRGELRAGAREASGLWWWYLVAGIAWTGLGMFVLSYRPGSLDAVAVLVGVAFVFGGIGQLVVANRIHAGMRWVFVVSGVLGVIAGVVTFAWPDITLYVVSILVAWYLVAFGVIHIVSALSGPKIHYWWTQLVLGISELVLGVWSIRSYQRSLLTFVTLVGVWVVFYGVAEIFAAFTLREVGKRVERVVE
jgi:uncharacterized membrane protein HdeD (DUF308 family)